jgi:hypothetical protein
MKHVFILLSILFISAGCSDEHLHPHDDNELITTVKLSFKSSTGAIKSYFWRDKQGDGVMDSVDPIVLDKNATYELTISLLDETKNPVFDISKEIEEEADVHLFVFKSTPAGLVNVTIKDLDKKGLPVGLLSQVKSQTTPGNGNFNVILKHQPPVNGKAVKNGSESIGSTDVDVSFPLSVQ